MATLEGAENLFADATTDFPAITDSPTDDNVNFFCEVLTNLLHSIDVLGGADSISGLLDDNADYMGRAGALI